ncbi:hypothetical protein [Saccharopolyspora terrae]|uniref:hypothetical protein n=1 Tax=Saccharopolyspora terrae TaxID=2530384 RepID=UPI0038B6925D
MAAEEGQFGVRANCIGVGFLERSGHVALVENRDHTEEYLETARRKLPLQTFGPVSDIAEAARFCCPGCRLRRQRATRPGGPRSACHSPGPTSKPAAEASDSPQP